MTELGVPQPRTDSLGPPRMRPEQIGATQIEAANAWAGIYAGDGEHAGDTQAEIVLRNPQAYATDVQTMALGGDLGERWQTMLSGADQLATEAATTEHEWSQANGLDKVHDLVLSGEIDPLKRGRVAALMQQASTLFSDSIMVNPGNTQYYEGNARAAVRWAEGKQ